MKSMRQTIERSKRPKRKINGQAREAFLIRKRSKKITKEGYSCVSRVNEIDTTALEMLANRVNQSSSNFL